MNADVQQHTSKQVSTSEPWLREYRHLRRLQADSMHNRQADSMYSRHIGSQKRLHTFCTLWAAPPAAAPRAALPAAARVRLAAGPWQWGEQLPLRRLPSARCLLGEAVRPREAGPGEGPLPPRSPAKLAMCSSPRYNIHRKHAVMGLRPRVKAAIAITSSTAMKAACFTHVVAEIHRSFG